MKKNNRLHSVHGGVGPVVWLDNQIGPVEGFSMPVEYIGKTKFWGDPIFAINNRKIVVRSDNIAGILGFFSGIALVGAGALIYRALRR